MVCLPNAGLDASSFVVHNARIKLAINNRLIAAAHESQCGFFDVMISSLYLMPSSVTYQPATEARDGHATPLPMGCTGLSS